MIAPLDGTIENTSADQLACARQCLADGRYSEAVEQAQAAHQQCADADHRGAGEAALLVAMCHSNSDEPVQALLWAEKALRYATLSSDRDLQARGWVVAGSSCAYLNQPVEAVRALDKAISLVDGATTEKMTLCTVFVGVGQSRPRKSEHAAKWIGCSRGRGDRPA